MDTATFIYAGGSVNGCDSIVTLDLTINNVNSAVTQLGPGTVEAEVSNAIYQWLDCANGFIEFTGETNQTFQCPGSCFYEVAVVVTENACSDTSDCVILNVLDLIDNNPEVSVILYPNPTSNSIYIKGLNQLKNIEAVELIDYNGRLIKSYREIDNILNVEFLSNGIYFINILHEEGRETLRLTIDSLIVPVIKK